MRRTAITAMRVGCAALLAVAVATPASARTDGDDKAIYCPRFDAYELHDCRPHHRLPEGALGEQLAWLLVQLAGGAETLTVDEVRGHLSPGLQDVIPAEEYLAALRNTLATVGPLRFVGFSYPPRAAQLMALAENTSGDRGAVALAVAGGLIDQADTDAAPPTLVPRGQYSGWFDVGGRRIFLRCTGRGEPTVVFDNGLTHDWLPLQELLTDVTRVCSYDPANQGGATGRSDPAPTPRTGADRVADLRAVLDEADVPGPYVLAGFSNGGLFDLLYSSSHPTEVVGLVLIDGVHPEYHTRLVDVVKPFVPPEQWPDLPAALCRIPPVQLDAEQMDICTAEAQTRAALAAQPLRPMPLVVLSHRPVEYPPDTLDAAGEALFTQLQAELAALLRGTRHVVAPTGEHDIHVIHPELVAAEITAVVHAVREG